jgi:hypothetical protein
MSGPKMREFREDYCEHKVSSVKVDGQDILSVEMALRREVGSNWWVSSVLLYDDRTDGDESCFARLAGKSRCSYQETQSGLG